MMKKIFVFTDGGARGNPGPAAVGFLIKDKDEKILKEGSKYIGETTNNVAEYMAVVEALRGLIGLEMTNDDWQINFFLDSKLVVNQLNGVYKVKDSKLRGLIVEVRLLEQKISGQIIYSFIRREKNRQADWLVNRSLDERG